MAEVHRMALLGGESSGKTTLAAALAAHLGTLWVPEYGRELWLEQRRTLTVAELLAVAQTQVQWEEEHQARVAATLPVARSANATKQSHAWLVCDTTPLTTLQYCLHDHGQAPPELHTLALRPYALTVVCEPDFAFVQDGARRSDPFRAQQHAWTLARLASQGVQPLLVHGSVQQRVQQVLDHLQSHALKAAP
jgi:HTH-type transcriptional regulator, transcriptional repressor of NAD biosynthesis genes